MRFAMSCLATLAIGGCIFTGTDEERVNVSVQYTRSDTALAGDPRIVNAGGAVQVLHHFDLPTSCYNFSASGRQTGATIKLTMIQTSGAIPGCPTEAAYWNFSALIAGVAGSATTLELTYDTDGTITQSQHPIPVPQ